MRLRRSVRAAWRIRVHRPRKPDPLLDRRTAEERQRIASRRMPALHPWQPAVLLRDPSVRHHRRAARPLHDPEHQRKHAGVCESSGHPEHPVLAAGQQLRSAGRLRQHDLPDYRDVPVQQIQGFEKHRGAERGAGALQHQRTGHLRLPDRL